MAAIVLALQWIEETNIYTGAVIFSDCLSALTALKHFSDESFVTEIFIITTRLKYRGIEIALEWIPGHCGIVGNEKADFYAKKALTQEIEMHNKLTLFEKTSLILYSLKLLWQER